MRYLLADRRRRERLTYILFQTVANFLIIGGIALTFLAFWPQVKVELGYWWGRLNKVRYSLEGGVDDKSYSPFSLLAHRGATIKVTPASRDFGLVIEKIGLNIPVVPNVSVADDQQYNESLRFGAAHAIGTSLPGQVGNTYIFAHSSLNFWDLGKYATAFNLLRKLSAGDIIHIFYKGVNFTYRVIDVTVVPGFDTYPLTRVFEYPVLTLQTCYPPGTSFSRLIVTAAMVN